MLLASAPAQQDLGKATFMLPSGVIKLEQLVRTASTCLHWQIRCDAEEVGEVEPLALQMPIATDTEAGAEVLHALLYARSLALVADPAEKDRYELLSLRGKRASEVFDRAPMLAVETLLQHPHGKRVVTTTVALQHANGTVMAAAIQPFLFPERVVRGGKTQSGPRLRVDGQHGITFTGCQDQVANLVKIAQACDQPTKPIADLATLTDQAKQLETQLAKLQSKLLELQAGPRNGGGK
jgi:hypothetical protein